MKTASETIRDLEQTIADLRAKLKDAALRTDRLREERDDARIALRESAQGTPEPPKVEEAAREIIRTLRPTDPGSWEGNMPYVVARLNSLRPYFPPASQTSETVPACPDCQKPLVPMLCCSDQKTCCTLWHTDDPRITKVKAPPKTKPIPVSKTEINTFAEHLVSGIDGFNNFPGKARIIDWIRDQADLWATPASTARTDGWASVEERLPKPDDDKEYVQVCWKDEWRGRKLSTNPDDNSIASPSGIDTCFIPYFLARHYHQATYWRELPAAPGSVPQAPDPLKDDSRCAVCCWPLAESAEKGCVRGNCSMRPFPEVFYDLERANREYGKKFGVKVGVPQAETPPWEEMK